MTLLIQADSTSTNLDTAPARDVQHVIALALISKEDESLLILSNKIRELRFKQGEMTQKQLAGRVGVSRQTMNAIENGRHAPTVDVAIRIADAFGIAVDELFELDYDGKPVRREPVTTRAVHRAEASVVEPVGLDAGFEPSEAGADRPASFADLRKILEP